MNWDGNAKFVKVNGEWMLQTTAIDARERCGRASPVLRRDGSESMIEVLVSPAFERETEVVRVPFKAARRLSYQEMAQALREVTL